ncbi:scavenger receptor cysteine-rich domain superfamily protein-like isoform X1 [Liolophura sinensis]|uniref:scavenger receptor cysteine-rich domain superfamily protein-like isoform X1 n=1 Tax=Liolophura sinensis TaxID=3198878 RepID=UPI0031584528
MSIRGLVLDYEVKSGLLYLTEDSFTESRKVLPNLPESLRGLPLAKVEAISRFHEIEEHKDKYGVGAIPCNLAWFKRLSFERFSKHDTCVFFTAASEGDIFIVFSVIPRDRTTWYYLQIGPQGVAIYKGNRVMKFISDAEARSLGDPRLYESYFVCFHEFAGGDRLSIKYGKTADNGAESYVYAVYEDDDPLHVRFYAFGNGETEATIMNVELFPALSPGTQICLGGTVLEQGRCVEKCHPQCIGCHSSGSDSTCRKCRNFKFGDRCVESCPAMYKPKPDSKTCVCALMEGGSCVQHCSPLRVGVRAEFGSSHCLCRVKTEKSDDCLLECPPATMQVEKNGRITCFNNVRLVGGINLASGRVEVRTKAGWGSVCDDDWGHEEAEVVCRQLGYCGGKATYRARFGEGTGPILMSYVNCSGSENNLNQCSHIFPLNCDHSEDAGVICKPCDLRLTGGDGHQGLVQVMQDGTWGTVCNVGWGDREATVVCRQLGFCNGTAIGNNPFASANGPVFYAIMGCQGNESNLMFCPLGANPGCPHRMDAAVECNVETPCMRLVNGPTALSGRLEVMLDETWGSVCDDSWDNNDARVVCRQLGYCGGLATIQQYFGSGSIHQPIHLDDVMCSGEEASLFQCPLETSVGQHNCEKSEDAGVFCSPC